VFGDLEEPSVTDKITPERIDELLRFLPEFTRPGRRYAKAWQGGARTEDGGVTLPYPEYERDVLEFFRLAAQEWWQDHDYYPPMAGAMLADNEAVNRATLEQVRTMLTCCVRGERFCDGYWEGLLESGRIVALLQRLAALRAEMAGGPGDRRTGG
jgi:hypothetical protein